MLGGYVSSLEATVLLQHREPGSFFVRFSKSSVGAFAVAFVDSKNRVKHCLLYPASGGGLTLREPPDVYASLLDFVAAHAARLNRPIGREAQLGGEWRGGGVGELEEVAVTAPYTRSLSTGDVTAASSGGGYSVESDVDEKMCVVCMAAPIETCFIPCGHVCVCRDCGGRLSDGAAASSSLGVSSAGGTSGGGGGRCPICRGPVNAVQPIFIV